MLENRTHETQVRRATDRMEAWERPIHRAGQESRREPRRVWNLAVHHRMDSYLDKLLKIR